MIFCFSEVGPGFSPDIECGQKWGFSPGFGENPGPGQVKGPLLLWLVVVV